MTLPEHMVRAQILKRGDKFIRVEFDQGEFPRATHSTLLCDDADAAMAAPADVPLDADETPHQSGKWSLVWNVLRG